MNNCPHNIFDSNLFASIISGIIALGAVFLERSINSRNAKKQEIDLFKKIYVDYFTQIKKQLGKIETLIEESKSLSYRQSNILRDIHYSHNMDKLRLYSINDVKLRNDIQDFFTWLIKFLDEDYARKMSDISPDNIGNDGNFITTVQNKKATCSDIITKIGKLK